MEKLFNIQYGTIYTPGGNGINNMAIIFDKSACFLKCGEVKDMEEYYNDMVSRYNKIGYSSMAKDLMLVSFDRYDGILNIEDICTLTNYMAMCSANGERILNILNMDKDRLIAEINMLREIGY